MADFFGIRFSKKARMALLSGAFLVFASSCGNADASLSSLPASSEEEKGIDYYPLNEGVANDQGLSYEIFVPSFADSDGDGVGDFLGIAAKASYLQGLGVNRVWLTPIHPTSSYHGYDVNDFYAVNSRFGTMSQFETMVETLRSKGIEVILDMVLNHSGRANPWFEQAVDDFIAGNINDDSKADWYVFDFDSHPGYNQYKGIYYESNFSPSMPEFNWDSEAWRAEVKNILAYWLEKGVAGFRLDAVLYYKYNDHVGNKEVCDYLRQCTEEDYPNCYFVGEAWTSNSILLNNYFSSGLDSYFDFTHSDATENTIIATAKGNNSGYEAANELASYVNAIKEENPKAIPSFFLSNHDTDRPNKFFTTLEAQKMSASLAYLLPGTPYIYYGEEINLIGTRGSEQTDGMRRLPMVWKSDESADSYRCDVPDSMVVGLANNAKPWAESGVDDLLEQGLSSVNHYRKVGNVRNRLKGIVDATMEAVRENSDYIMHYILHAEDDFEIVHNTSREPVTISIREGLSIFDSIDSNGLPPTVSGDNLIIPACSTVVLK